MPRINSLEVFNLPKTSTPRLVQLMRDNMETPRHAIRGEVSADEATIYLYEVIDEFWGIGAEAFVKELNALSAPTIHVRINSPGGDVFAARAIVTAIKAHPSKVIAHVDGVAASAASFIAVACDEVEMTDGALFMIHKAWAFAFGNADELLALAALLEKVDDSIVADYTKKTKKSKAELEKWMRAETWFNAQEAKEAGFVDRVYDGDPVENAWDLDAFENAPKDQAPKKDPDREAKTLRDHAERRLKLLEKCPA